MNYSRIIMSSCGRSGRFLVPGPLINILAYSQAQQQHQHQQHIPSGISCNYTRNIPEIITRFHSANVLLLATKDIYIPGRLRRSEVFRFRFNDYNGKSSTRDG